MSKVVDSDANDPEDSDGPSYYLWKPFSLQFAPRAREEAFQTLNKPSRNIQDLLGFAFTVFIAPIIVYEFYQHLPLAFSLSFLSISLGFSPFCIYLIVKKQYVLLQVIISNRVFCRCTYEKLRFGLLLFSKAGVIIWAVMLGRYIPISTSLSGLLGSMMLKSSTSGMFFAALVFRFPFKTHIVVHTIVLMEGLLWVPEFCSRCAFVSEVHETFHKVKTIFCSKLLHDCLADLWTGSSVFMDSNRIFSTSCLSMLVLGYFDHICCRICLSGYDCIYP